MKLMSINFLLFIIYLLTVCFKGFCKVHCTMHVQFKCMSLNVLARMLDFKYFLGGVIYKLPAFRYSKSSVHTMFPGCRAITAAAKMFLTAIMLHVFLVIINSIEQKL